jgi:large subunit ribosomal protein L31
VTYASLQSTFEIFGSVVVAIALLVAFEAWRTRRLTGQPTRPHPPPLERDNQKGRYQDTTILRRISSMSPATCGTTFALRSTAATLSIEVCSNCHPAYTGVQLAGIGGDRIERFTRRRALAASRVASGRM